MAKSVAAPAQAIAQFYRDNPRMVSSPFGGIDGVHTALLDEVFTRLDIDLSGRRVLDVGCGRGLVREVVEGRGGSYAGVDLVANGRGFPLSLGDAAALPFAAASFDAVFCIDAFEHIPSPADAARELRRVLRPGGIVFLSAPNYGNVAGLVKWWCERIGNYERHTWAPFGRWQPQEWETPLTLGRVWRIFRQAGFDRGRVIGHSREIELGVFPWIDHPAMPDGVRFRLQRLFRHLGPPIASAVPTASLHGFWKFSLGNPQ